MTLPYAVNMNKKERGIAELNAMLEGNTLPFIDSHFHCNSIAKHKDIEEILTKMGHSGFAGGIDVGTDCDDLPEREKLLKKHPSIRLSAGIGPWGLLDQRSTNAQLTVLKNNITTEKIVAIGEIGLDNHWDYGSRELQEELFINQLELAESLKLPIIIHTRDADEQMIAILKERTFSFSGIVHCFSSSQELAKTALDKDLYISFAGPITYAKNTALREILGQIPHDRLLLETDAPYLSPEPLRGSYNTPLNIPLTYRTAAQIRKVSLEQLAETVVTNFGTLLAGR